MLNPGDHYAVYEGGGWKIRIASTNHPSGDIIIRYSESIEVMRKQLTEMMYAGQMSYGKYIELLDSITSIVDERGNIDPVSYAMDRIEKFYSDGKLPKKSDILTLFEYCLSQYQSHSKYLTVFFEHMRKKPKSSIDLENTVVALNQDLRLSNIEISRMLSNLGIQCDRRRVHKILKANHVIPIDGRARRYQR